MTRKQVAWWSCGIALSALTILAYLMATISPYLPSGELNRVAIFCFILSLTLFCAAVGALFCLLLHRRWPGLAGEPELVDLPEARSAVRQGLLFALGVSALSLFALFKILDIAFVMVALVLIGLLEIFLQGR